jgi:hypothetical protein
MLWLRHRDHLKASRRVGNVVAESRIGAQTQTPYWIVAAEGPITDDDPARITAEILRGLTGGHTQLVIDLSRAGRIKSRQRMNDALRVSAENVGSDGVLYLRTDATTPNDAIRRVSLTT